MTLVERALIEACRRSWRAYKHANFTVSIDGLRVPVVEQKGLSNLAFRRPQFLTVLAAARELNPKGHVIDIGANVGLFLLNLISIHRDQPYIGFEPQLPAAEYVRRVIMDNRLSNHSILGIALSDRTGSASIHFGSEADVSATLSTDQRPPSMYKYAQRVATATADSQLGDVASIAFVKLDVEGLELSVLRGMTTTIDRLHPPMLIEVMPYAYLLDSTYDRTYFGSLAESEAKRVAEARRQHSLGVEGFLRERGYAFYACEYSGRTTPARTLDRGASKDRETDFLALPLNTATAFMAALSRA
jgi:FkbM family methyltransferase